MKIIVLYYVLDSRCVRNKDVGTNKFYRLGEIIYAMSDDEDITTSLIKKFMEEFKEENDFIDYFQKTWCHDESHISKIEYIILIMLYFHLHMFIYYVCANKTLYFFL